MVVGGAVFYQFTRKPCLTGPLMIDFNAYGDIIDDNKLNTQSIISTFHFWVWLSKVFARAVAVGSGLWDSF